MDSEEKKKIVEVMKAKKGESNLDWMYKGMAPDTNDYLLGKKIDNYIEKKSETTKDGKFSTNFVTRVKTNVGMDTATQMREDPLFLMRKQEEEARRRILDNPIKMKQIQKMLKSHKKSHKSKKLKKSKKKKKHRDSDSSSSLDSSDELVKTYLAIVKKKNTDHCDEEQNLVEKIQQSSHYGLIKNNSSHQSSERNTSRSYQPHTSHSNSTEKDEEKYKHKHKSYHSHRDSSSKHDSSSSRSKHSDQGQSRSSSSHTRHRSRTPPPKKLSATDREKKLQEMMIDAKWHSDLRAQNVKVYEKECEMDEKNTHKGSSSDFLNPMMSHHASQSSVEERIRRNRYNIQRTKSQLNANFTKR